jgi:hypothetical protein
MGLMVFSGSLLNSDSLSVAFLMGEETPQPSSEIAKIVVRPFKCIIFSLAARNRN